MDIAHEVGGDQIQFVVRTVDVDALRIEHRTHRAIKDVNAVAL
jgi:hypothetical protein